MSVKNQGLKNYSLTPILMSGKNQGLKNYSLTPILKPINDNVFLIGPMGSGKTAVGMRLARLTNREFLDSDAEIERSTGVDVGFIFEKEGESGFRRRERLMISELTSRQGIVLATGGGAVLDPGNRNGLSANGYVVYLAATVDSQFERARRSRTRPLLETDDPRARLDALMLEREPLYRQIADHEIVTDSQHPDAVARLLQRHLAQIGEQ